MLPVDASKTVAITSSTAVREPPTYGRLHESCHENMSNNYIDRGHLISDLVHSAAAKATNRPAVEVVGGDTLSFDRLAVQTEEMAGQLLEAGVRRGDRIAVMAANGPTYFTAYLGAAHIGAAAVPIGPRLAPTLANFIINDAQPVLGIADAHHAGALAETGLPVLDPENRSSHRPRGDIAQAEPDDTAIIIYTSGTSGLPKGVCLSQDAIIHNAHAITASQDLTSKDIHLTATPMHHATGAMRVYAMLLNAQTHVILDKFDPGMWLDTVESRGITSTVAVPTQLQRIFASAEFTPERLESLRLLLYGGGPSPRSLIRYMLESLPCGLYHGYGLTEASTIVTAADASDHLRADDTLLGSVGAPIEGVEVRVVNDQGSTSAQGEVGEIIVRSRKVMTKYWKNPAATQQVLRDGWLWTGDLASSDGLRLSLAGRRTELIISGGVNIYPAQVEQAIAEITGVAEVAVIGLPDDEWGEAVTAVVRTRPGHDVSRSDILAEVEKRLARHMRPRKIEFVTDFPRTPNGKIQKHEIVTNLST